MKDRAFHIATVYVNSLDPSRGCTLQVETDRYHFIRAKRKPQRNSTSAVGECGGWEFPTVLLRGQFVRPAKTIWKFLDFSIMDPLTV